MHVNYLWPKLIHNFPACQFFTRMTFISNNFERATLSRQCINKQPPSSQLTKKALQLDAQRIKIFYTSVSL